MGKVVVVKCPLCGWSRRYRADMGSNKFFNGSVTDGVIIIQEAGGKIKRSAADLDAGVIRKGRGSAKGRIEVKQVLRLQDLDPESKRRIRIKAKEILTELG